MLSICRNILLLTFVATMSGESVKFAPVYQPNNDVKIDHRVAIRMRDGVILYADVYRPAQEGKYPVLVSRTPYSTQRAPNSHEEPLFFASRGYVFVFQDVRGRHESEGKWSRFATT